MDYSKAIRCVYAVFRLKSHRSAADGLRCEKNLFFLSILQKTTLILDVVKNLKSVPFIDLNGYLIFLNNFGRKNPVAEKHSFVL